MIIIYDLLLQNNLINVTIVNYQICLNIINWTNMRKALLRINKYQKVRQKMVIEEDLLKNALSKLFSYTTAKKDLSSKLKILPNYFDHIYIDMFCSSANYNTYLNYVNSEHSFSNKQSTLKQYFKESTVTKILSNNYYIRYLQAYINWLINQCKQFDIYSNDYAIEQLNLDRPDKWFQTKHYCSNRQFIYHHGPTNSGKSTAAIQDLKTLKYNQKGIYMAPLRLLAWQYQQKLGNCTLITGQQKQFKNSNLISCTIEAAPLNADYQVAVIDEIQMIGDAERGWAWTRAILATKAKRIHLCGDQRALHLISRLVQITQDKLEQRTYSRLSKLTLIHKIFNLQSLSAGDCIVDFSMNKLLRNRNEINKFFSEKQKVQDAKNLSEIQKMQNSHQNKDNQKLIQRNKITSQNFVNENMNWKGNFAAIVYGRLPPQCKRQQAKLFNNQQLPYLVATNAIGMGLNLNIKKVIFMSIDRNFSDGPKVLQQHEIQQIAGRAGRGKQTGYVQCASPSILKIVSKALLNVNKTYNIQLQNINDEQQSINQQQKEQKLVPVSSVYSNSLQRSLKSKQCQIQQARFYFQVDYIIFIKHVLQKAMKKQFHYLELIEFIINYCQLNQIYLFQAKEEIDYLINLLEKNNYDIEEIYMFLLGLGLSIPADNTPKHIKSLIVKTHQDYVRNFITFRKVSLPQFLVLHHINEYKEYKLISQIAELQYFFNLLQTYVWLWNKFQFAFYQINLAKEIKISLANKINQILQNNTHDQKSEASWDKRQTMERKRQRRIIRKQKKEFQKDFKRSKYQNLQNIQKKSFIAVNEKDNKPSPEYKAQKDEKKSKMIPYKAKPSNESPFFSALKKMQK